MVVDSKLRSYRTEKRIDALYYVTGTFHGAHVYAISEGEARRIFHKHYNGESIIHLIKATKD